MFLQKDLFNNVLTNNIFYKKNETISMLKNIDDAVNEIQSIIEKTEIKNLSELKTIFKNNLEKYVIPINDKIILEIIQKHIRLGYTTKEENFGIFKGLLRPTVSIDFDDTIKDNLKSQFLDQTAPLIKNAKAAILTLDEIGCRLILNTMRENNELFLAQEYLKQHGIFHCFDSFNENIIEIFKDNRKIYANYNIDDKNIGGLPDWKESVLYIINDWGIDAELSNKIMSKYFK